MRLYWAELIGALFLLTFCIEGWLMTRLRRLWQRFLAWWYLEDRLW